MRVFQNPRGAAGTPSLPGLYALERVLTFPELLMCSDESLTPPPEELARVNLSGAHTV